MFSTFIIGGKGHDREHPFFEQVASEQEGLTRLSTVGRPHRRCESHLLLGTGGR
jgi:hypothetical protein